MQTPFICNTIHATHRTRRNTPLHIGCVLMHARVRARVHTCIHLQTTHAISSFQLSNYIPIKTPQSSVKLVRSWDFIHPSSIFG